MRRVPGPVLLAVLLGLFVSGCSKKSVDGHWTGAIQISTVKLNIETDFKTNSGTLAGTMDIPQQGAQKIPLSIVTQTGSKLHFELKSPLGLAAFEGDVKGNKIDGTFTQGVNSGEFHLTKAAP